MQKRAAWFVTGNYTYETVSMAGILEQLKWESLKNRRKDTRLIMLYKGLMGAASIPRVSNRMLAPGNFVEIVAMSQIHFIYNL